MRQTNRERVSEKKATSQDRERRKSARYRERERIRKNPLSMMIGSCACASARVCVSTGDKRTCLCLDGLFDHTMRRSEINPFEGEEKKSYSQ